MQDTVVLVTGASKGIGLEVARQLARRGATVLVSARDPERAESAAAAAAADGGDVRPLAVGLDVADGASVRAAAAALERGPGRLDVLVNNAAAYVDWTETASAADLGAAETVVQTNLFGAWRVTRALLPLLRRSPHPRVVNVSSGSGSLAEMGAGTPAYSVSKAALNALTRILAAELRPDRVLVNAVCPGWVATDMGGAGGRPVADGAASVTWAVLLDDDGPTGGFFRDGRPVAW